MNKRKRSGALAAAAAIETKRCAIYTRKSTSIGLEQEFNSLDAQREACEQYIRNQASIGWKCIEEKYDDGGFTGANIERPAFQRLLADVDADRVDVVVVYKVDRLSRSLLDFVKVMECFSNAGVSFVSITQNFSTADAIGRLTLNMLMSFAEFERSMIAERTRDKIAASRRRGKWTGGPTPLGYDVVDRKLVVNECEAPLVRRVFELYLEKRSAVGVAHILNAEHQTTKYHSSSSGNSRGAKTWNKNSVLNLLRSPIAAGFMSCGEELYESEHKAIIDRTVYFRAQQLLDQSGRKGIRYGANPDYILVGILRCARCKKAFTPASTRRGNRIYRYYRCSTRDKLGRGECQSGPLPAPAIEKYVVERLREALAESKLIEELTDAVIARLEDRRKQLLDERATLPSKIASISTEGRRLVETASTLEGSARRLLNDKLQDVGDQLGRLEARLAEVHRQIGVLDAEQLEVGWVTKCLHDFDPIWEVLTSENRGRLIRAIVSRVEVDEPNNDVRVVFTNLDAAPDEGPKPEEASA